MLIPDLLTDILQTMRLEHTILCRCELTAPWGIRLPAEIGEAVFHIVTRGQCWLCIKDNQKPLLLATGDFVMFPHGHEHIICDTLSSPITDFEDTSIMRPNHGYNSISFGGGGLPIELLAGCFQVRGDRRNPLLASLPSLIHIRSDHGQLVPWLETTLHYITAELAISQIGFQTVIARLIDVLFIQVVRAYIARSDDQRNWLRALTDAEMVIALSLIHRSPEKPWTVASLAEQVLMSRSAFSARFTELVGQPPIQYLTTWRMVKATELLRESQLGLKEVATLVGYESEISFSKAFKRWSGVAPSFYRQDHSASELSTSFA